MEQVLRSVLGKMDVEDFYKDYFGVGKVGGTVNLPCPFPWKHKAGEDKLPSFRVFLDTGGTYCHGCGYKSTNPVYFWADAKGLKYQDALADLYARHVEPTVDKSAWSGPAERLLGNKLLLARIKKLRGLTKETVEKRRLGYDGKRLTIPIFNELGLCVNIRRYDLFKVGGPKMVSWKEGFGKARLYPLDSLKEKAVFVVEGELDALIGCQEGLACVSPSGGSLTWNEEWSKALAGKCVYVLPDNDAPGRSGAEIRRKSISKFAASCSVVELPVKEQGEDLTDFFVKYGRTAADLLKLADGAAQSSPAPQARANGSQADIFDGSALGKTKAEELVVARAEAVWADLVDRGGFFRNAVGELFYAKEGLAAMRVTSGVGHFMSYLSARSPLVNQATGTGKFIYNHILHKAHGESEMSKTGVWSMFDGGVLYAHAGKDELLKFSPNKQEVIKNAINKDRVLLDLPMQSMAIPKLPNNKPSGGLGHLKDLFMENLSMAEEDRYLLVCWLMCIFFRDYVRPKPLVRLLAKTASGKSTSSKLVSVLLYGEELLSHSASTVAATYEMSSRYPLLILDNLEVRNMTPSLEDFLLVAATGGMKAKRQMSTDTGLVLQQTNSLVLTNGIEPFGRHELIDRTIEIDLDLEKFGSKRFQEARVIGELKAGRKEVFSATLFLIHKYVMPRVAKGEIHRIMKEFSRHGKERFNEYLALMCIMLDALWGYMPLQTYRRPHDLVNHWLDSQTHAEQRQDEGTNEVLYFLSTFVERQDQLLGALIRVERAKDGKVSMKCTTRELLSDFRVMAKHLGMRCPWTNERHLGSRLADSEDILNRAGWTRRSYVSSGRARWEYFFVPKERRTHDRR